MIIWFGIFTMAIFLILGSLSKINVAIVYMASTIILISLIFITFSKNSYFQEKVDRQSEFVTNFGNYVSNGDVIKILSKEKDNVFLDGHDDLIYWESDRTSKYKYSFFTSVMPAIKRYVDERDNMLRDNPPDFYYGFCPNNSAESITLPSYLKNYYRQLYFAGKSTCLYISKLKIKQISNDLWEKVRAYGYYLPSI